MERVSPLQVKCDQYWPTRATETYGLIQVTLLDTVELATYCVRTFALFKVRSIRIGAAFVTSLTMWSVLVTNLFASVIQNGSSEKREVRQFQFTAWPDHGVPEHPTPFLAFLRRVKACNPPDAGPMAVHCRWETTWYHRNNLKHEIDLLFPFAVMNIWKDMTKCLWKLFVCWEGMY